MVGWDGPAPDSDRTYGDTVAGPCGMGPSQCSHPVAPSTPMRIGTLPPHHATLYPSVAAHPTPARTLQIPASPAHSPATPGTPPAAHGCAAAATAALSEGPRGCGSSPAATTSRGTFASRRTRLRPADPPAMVHQPPLTRAPMATRGTLASATSPSRTTTSSSTVYLRAEEHAWRAQDSMPSFTAVALEDTDIEERISPTQMAQGCSYAAAALGTTSPIEGAAALVVPQVKDVVGEASDYAASAFILTRQRGTRRSGAAGNRARAAVELDRGIDGTSHMPLVHGGGMVVRPLADQCTMACRRAGSAAVGDLCIRIGLGQGTPLRRQWGRWSTTLGGRGVCDLSWAFSGACSSSLA